ncbi:M16 family metallopeptidase [Psychromonas hadalis]|uniref:M16 family metallopeptidase n=1 Tax=Psychromonas hadalis TaxID=211669 RepID=UPI0003B5FEF1|nr:M16 family metallopeptidase [Psychromonas hadalis]
MRTIKKGVITLITLFTLTACMSSSPNPENSFATISEATLDNGFSYAIHAKQESSQKIQLRLFIKSGSLSETEQQQGYAHLLEHMAFNGTKHFPKNKIIELFEKSGLTFGHDINAYTSFTETVYTLSVPVADKKLLKETLLYLRDVLTDIEFDQAELDKEQGVVQNEYRVSVPQEKPYYYALFDDYIATSHYQSHLPLGTLESVGNSTEAGVKAFYKQWYRPNNAKLLITGDVDSELTKMLIIDTFSSIASSHNEIQQVVPDAPKLKTASKAFSSKVIIFSQTDLFFEVPQLTITNSEQLSQAIKLDLLDNMLNYRLNVLNSELKHPFNEISFSYLRLLNNQSFKSITISYQKENVKESVIFIAQELARLQQHGFSQAEYALQYEALQAQQSELKNNYLNQTSAQIANSVINSWANGNTLFSYELEQQAYQNALATLSLDEINQLTRTLIKSPKKLTFAYTDVALQPEFLMADKNFAKYFEQTIANTSIKIEKVVFPIIKRTSAISAIKSEKFYPKKQITQLALHNGVDVILQPDYSVKNAISMSFTAPGGTNTLTKTQIAANTLLINSYMNSGLAGLSPQALHQKMLSAKAVLTPFSVANSHGFTMQSVNNSKSLKLLFSMLYSAINDATIKTKIFALEKAKLIDQQESYLAQPTTNTQIKLLEALWPNSRYQHVFSVEELQVIQQSDVESLHALFFGSVNGYKLTIVGDFDVDEMKTLIVQYIAPLQGGKLHQFNQQPQPLIQQATKINETTNPQDNAIVSFGTVTDNKNHSIKEVYQADLMRRIITQTLNKEIREKLSLTYTPSVYVADQQAGNNFTEVFIQMVTKVEDAQQTQQVVSEIINDFVSKGITNEQLTDHQRGLTQGMLSNLHKSTDRQWLLHRDHLQGFELDSTENAEAIVSSISLADMNQFIKIYLDPTKTVQMINIPK